MEKAAPNWLDIFKESMTDIVVKQVVFMYSANSERCPIDALSHPDSTTL
jgi:hypothetical protein